MKYHCGNHGCIMGGVTGMATNGKCRCLADITPEKRIRLGAGIRALRERVRLLEKALSIIAADEDLLDENPDSFGKFAARQMQSIARAALASGGGDRGE